MRGKILVTPRAVTRHGHPSLELLRKAGWEVIFCSPGVQPSEKELKQLLPGCAGYLAGVEPVTAKTLEAADCLQAISRNGTGVDNIDLAAAAARGIVLLRADGANARSVAELAIGQLLALARGFAPADAALKRGVWDRGSGGMEIDGKILGIAGCGRIGKIVARLALALGMKVIAFDVQPDPDFSPGAGFSYAELDEVIVSSDFLTLHCPPDRGRPLIDANSLSRMKKGVFILNAARYDVMDAGAVLAALESGHLAGLALDVFDSEPPGDVRLVHHPRVLATPHLGGFTKESIARSMLMAVENLLGALR